MTKFIINGGHKLHGEVAISGSKHSAVSMIIGSLLTDEPIEISNVPDILDVKYACDYVGELGKKVSWPRKNKVRITGAAFGIRLTHTAKKLRYSLLGLGIQLARTGQANMFLPGGCELGDRQHNFHLDGLNAMGAEVEDVEEIGIIGRVRLHGGLIDLPYPSVSATLNLICAASLAEGFSIIRNVARNPEVMDFIEFLKAMGAKIELVGEASLQISGVEKLHGCHYHIMNDRIETVTLIIATAIAGGSVTLVGGNLMYLQEEALILSRIGISITQMANGVKVKSLRGHDPADIITAAYPGFHTDVQPLITAMLASAACGNSRVIESINDNRFRYVKELRKMGADIEIQEAEQICPNGKHGQKASIWGIDLHGAEVTASDLRGGAALVLAALGAKGQTVINNVEQIDRGYEGLDEKLHKLGADIKRVSEAK